MPVTLTTFASGAVINATTLRERLQQAETYVNEEIEQSDRAEGWMEANHLYRPDFYGGANPHTTLVTGESYWRTRPLAEERRAFFAAYYGGTGPYRVPGLGATIQIPEALNPSGTRYRLVVCASFYAYEFGGSDAELSEVGAVRSATFNFMINGVMARTNSCQRDIFKGSKTLTEQAVPFYPRKQISMVYGDTSAPVAQVGCNNIGVTVNPVGGGGSIGTVVKHIIIVQGSMIARYFIR
jgi:hypothetical protein